MARYTPSNKGGDLAPINVELEKIKEAIDDTLSRKGDAPNAMQTPLDMNGHRILNLPEPKTSNEPARLKDIQAESGLPVQDSNAGKYLQTDGFAATWKQIQATDVQDNTSRNLQETVDSVDSKQLNSLVDLATAEFVAGQKYQNFGFYPDTEVGGGVWKAVSGLDKSTNNGGTVATVEALVAWRDAAIAAGGLTTANLQANLDVLFEAGTGTGDGYERVTSTSEETDLLASWFGVSEGEDSAAAYDQLFKESSKAKAVTINDVRGRIEEEITVALTYGINCKKPITISADITPITIRSVSRASMFYWDFESTLSTAIGNCCVLFDCTINHLFNVYIQKFKFERSASEKTWGGIAFKGDGIYGVFGSRISGVATIGLKYDVKTLPGSYFFNTVKLTDFFSSYSSKSIDFTEKRVTNCDLSSIFGQECSELINAGDSVGCTFKKTLNYDTSNPDIVFGTGSKSNKVLGGVEADAITDNGVNNYINQEGAYSLDTESSSAQKFLTNRVQATKESFLNLFDSEIIGSARLYGAASYGAAGKSFPSAVIDSGTTSGDEVRLKKILEIVSGSGGAGLYERYAKLRTSFGFRIVDTTDGSGGALPDYSFVMGLYAHAANASAVYSRAFLLTNIGGNFAIVKNTTLGSSPTKVYETVFTLGTIDNKYHEFNIVSNQYQSSAQTNMFHFDGVYIGAGGDILEYHRSPYISAENNGARCRVALQFAECRLQISQAWN